jgi:N4-acetylcytidine amidohydrolase
MLNMTDHTQLPPKKGEPNQLVTIQEDIEKVLAGKKTAVRRNSRYADPGEVWELSGQKFQVDRVYQQSLGELTDANAVDEGYENLEAYKDSILSLHPGMPWVPHMKVWVHEFSPVK